MGHVFRKQQRKCKTRKPQKIPLNSADKIMQSKYIYNYHFVSCDTPIKVWHVLERESLTYPRDKNPWKCLIVWHVFENLIFIWKCDIPLKMWHTEPWNVTYHWKSNTLLALNMWQVQENVTYLTLKCDFPMKMWHPLENLTYSWKCDSPLKIWHTFKNVIYPWKCDLP